MTIKQYIALQREEDLAWRIRKSCFFLVWYLFMGKVVFSYDAPGMATGFCSVLPCGLLGQMPVKLVIMLAAALLGIFYITEHRMRWATAGLFIISGYVFSFEESHGVQQRSAIFTVIFLFQALAYFTQHVAQNRNFFSFQAVVATYMLSGLSKLLTAGWRWPLDAPYLLLQVQKGAYYRYFDTGDPAVLEAKMRYIRFFADHPALLSALLAAAVLLELTAFVLLVSKRFRILYGILFLLMHIGISVVMDIVIFPIVLSMIIILLNPVYAGVWGMRRLFRRDGYI